MNTIFPFDIIALLFIQNNSKFKQAKIRLPRSVDVNSACLSESLGDKGLFRSANILQGADVVLGVVVLLFLLSL